MLERLSQEEIEQLLSELKDNGYNVTQMTKAVISNQEAKKIFGCNVFISGELKKAMYTIADKVTNNYEEKAKVTRKRQFVPQEIEKEYREIIRGIINAIKPYFGMIGFCEKK